MSQETKSALLIGFIFIMIVLVVVVDGLDAGRTPALNEVPTDEMPIVPPAEDDSFQRSQPPASGPIETAKAQVEQYWEVERGDTLSGICAEKYGDAGLFPALQKTNGLKSNAWCATLSAASPETNSDRASIAGTSMRSFPMSSSRGWVAWGSSALI